MRPYPFLGPTKKPAGALGQGGLETKRPRAREDEGGAGNRAKRKPLGEGRGRGGKKRVK